MIVSEHLRINECSVRVHFVQFPGIHVPSQDLAQVANFDLPPDDFFLLSSLGVTFALVGGNAHFGAKRSLRLVDLAYFVALPKKFSIKLSANRTYQK